MVMDGLVSESCSQEERGCNSAVEHMPCMQKASSLILVSPVKTGKRLPKTSVYLSG